MIPESFAGIAPIRSEARDGELARWSLYQEKLKHLEQRHEIFAAWIVMVFVALLVISPESFLG
jgi:hypothetical protein